MMIDRGLVPLTRPFTHEKAPVFFSTIAVGRQSRRTPWKRGLTVPRTHTFHQQCSTNLWYTSKRVHTLDHRLYKPNSTCKHTRAPALTFIQTIYIYPNTSKHHVLSILHIHIVCLRECECVLLRGRSWQSYGTVARLSLIDAFSSNPPNPYVRVELTKRKSFGQRSLDNRASEL